MAKRATSCCFATERLDDALALQCFGEIGRKIGDAFLRAVRARRDEPLETRDGKSHNRRDDDQGEREQPIEVNHRRKRRDEGHQRDDQLRQRHADRVGHELEIGAEAGEQFARPPAIEGFQRKVEQAFEQADPQPRDEMLTAPRREVRLVIDGDVGQDQRDRRNAKRDVQGAQIRRVSVRRRQHLVDDDAERGRRHQGQHAGQRAEKGGNHDARVVRTRLQRQATKNRAAAHRRFRLAAAGR